MDRVAIITGGSQGLGLALARSLAQIGYSLVIDARRADRLAAAEADLAGYTRVVAVPGDITDADHRRRLVDAAAALGPITALVNNASTLGQSPLPRLGEIDADVLRRTFETNVVAPVAVYQLASPYLGAGAAVVNITSDAAVEGYPGWGGYGASKAALEQVARVLAAERPDLPRAHRRPRRHAHGDAPGRFPWRGHQRSGAAGRERSRPRRPHRGHPTEWPLHRPRGGVVSASAVLEHGLPLSFALDYDHEAHEPPEIHRAGRDDVRLLVSRGLDEPLHTTFTALPDQLEAGDLMVVNTSATIAAAVDVVIDGCGPAVLHLSTELPGELWMVEPRHKTGNGSTRPLALPDRPTTVRLPDGRPLLHLVRMAPESRRLWLAVAADGVDLDVTTVASGRPIRYPYVTQDWPLESYQTVFATEPGSSEMPSAARPFTADIVTRLVSGGIGIAPITLHTGVSSLEAGERPYTERYRVPPATANHVNATRRAGGHVVAVGTTVVRALETVTDRRGATHPGEGWTDLVVTPERGVRAVDGLLTGWHEPRATHLAMLEAVAGRDALVLAYEAAFASGYRWHEFGDSHLILPYA